MKKNDKKVTRIGGQAVIEGVMMRDKTSMAICVRSDEGLLLTSTQRLKEHKKIRKMPILRGIYSFFSSLISGTATLNKSTKMVEEDENTAISGTAATLSVLVALVVAIGIFFFIPSMFGSFFYDKIVQNVLLKNLISGALRLILFIAYIFLVSLLKDVKRTFRYHGAEHKTINCYESGAELTVENIAKCSRLNNRCGTTFMFLVMLISIIVFAIVDYLLFLIVPLGEGFARTAIYMAAKLIFLPIVAGISYEVLFLLSNMGDNIFVRILRAPGLGLQRITTAEPDNEMIEVALIAFNLVLKMEQDPTILGKEYDKIPLNDCFDLCYGVLDALNAERVEADWLLCHILHCRRGQLKANQYISLGDYKKLKILLEKRKSMPLDYCLNVSEFCGYEIFVDERVLIPRAETEILAEKAVEILNEKDDGRGDFGAKALEICCGSGCVSLVLSRETNAQITASDISDAALAVAQKNLDGRGVAVTKSDLFAGFVGKKFDVIVANPPYIASEEIETLAFEVRCQPRIALDGGEDGLRFYRKIAENIGDFLEENGVILLEIGYNQAEKVSEIFAEKGYKNIEIIKDLSGNDRVMVAK